MALGGYLIWIALAVEILTLTAYILNFKEWSKYAYLTTSIFLTVPTLLLFYHFFSRDFRVEYVTAYSSSDLSAIYTFSAFWAGQEGSFLLWAFMSAIVGLFLLSVKWEWQRPVMIFYNSILLALLILLVKQTPFRLLANVPVDGSGLNPLLQNPWMAIHPPIMFLGYAAYGFPFAFVMAALWKKELSHWIDISYKWLVFAWLSLGVGIILGGYWAYVTLGWGGYWGWDPVENASFVPFLFGTALLHGIVLQRKFKAFYRTNAVLAILSFVLILYGTFLTRSGVLSDFSVHSFLDLGITGWLLLLLGIFLIGGLGLFFYRFKDFPEGEKIVGFLSPMALLATSVVLLVMSGTLVILGTSSPIITRLPFFETPSQVGIPFYVNTQIPIYSLLLIVFTIFAIRKKIVPIVLGATVAVTVLSFIYGVKDPLHLILVALSTSTITAQLSHSHRISTKLIHAGVGFFILGSIYATGYDSLTKVALVQDVPREVGTRTMTFTDFTVPPGKQHTAVILNVNDGKRDYTITPELWFNQRSNQIVANPSIKMGWIRDEYYASHEYNPPKDSSAITIQKGQETTVQGVPITFLGFKIDQEHKMGEGMVVRALLAIDGNSENPLALEYRMVPGIVPEMPIQSVEGHAFSLQLERMEATSGTIVVKVHGSEAATSGATTVVEFTVVPFISFVWLGTILMILGGIFSMFLTRKPNDLPVTGSEPEDDQAEPVKPEIKEASQDSAQPVEVAEDETTEEKPE